jgi:tripartite motif-containing protein 71
VTSYGTFGTRADWRDPPQFNHPTGVLNDTNGQIYVADTLNHRVVVLDKNGLVVLTWGTQGEANGQFNMPRTVSQDHFGNIWVLDSGNSRVQIFSELGAFNNTFGSYGTDPNANTLTAVMNRPLGMAINSIDQTFVVDSGNFRMQVLNDGGLPVTWVGWYGEGPFQFKDPHGVAVTPSQMAAIADGFGGRVIFYNSRNGDFEVIGQWKAKDEILNDNYDPKFCGIAADAQNRLYITDINNDCIIRLAPLKYQVTPTQFTPTPTPAPVDPYGGVGYPIR